MVSASRDDVLAFIRNPPRRPGASLLAVSLFSGAGLSDVGYSLAGFSFQVQAEADRRRVSLCAANFSNASSVVGDLRNVWQSVVTKYCNRCDRLPDLLVATPPCQGMSSSNPGRGKVADPDSGDRRARERNLLIFPVAEVAEALEPRIIVIENVPQLLLRTVRLRKNGRPRNVVEVFIERLPEYKAFKGVVQMADYGIPQVRRRSVLVLVRKDDVALKVLEEHNALPWPRGTHSEYPLNGEPPWVTVEEWFQKMKYRSLDAQSPETARDVRVPLHFVPVYPNHRYLWVAEIPPRSGANAYQNSRCPTCGQRRVSEGRAYCDRCGGPMLNRPHVRLRNGRIRLIKGFLSSYRRMKANRPAPTITTASGHLGSDFTIHPWENRVLSILECADLQTIPRTYDWSWALERGLKYMIRQVAGEAMPPWFTYLHGRVLRSLLAGRLPDIQLAEAPSDERIRA